MLVKIPLYQDHCLSTAINLNALNLGRMTQKARWPPISIGGYRRLNLEQVNQAG